MRRSRRPGGFFLFLWHTIRRISSKPARFIEGFLWNDAAATYKRQFKPQYWQRRQASRTLAFKLAKLRWFARIRRKSTIETASIFSQLLKHILGSLVLAFLVALVLAEADKEALRYAVTHGRWSWLSSEFIERIRSISTEHDRFVQITASIAQIAGIFVGLYFTAISLVASSLYADASRRIRSLFLNEEGGIFYLRLVAFTGGFSVILLGGALLQVRIGILNLLLLLFLAFYSMVGFVVFGLRAFRFLDPVNLVGCLKRQYYDLMKQGLRKDGLLIPSFQSYYQKQIEEVLTTNRELIAMVVDAGQIDAQRLGDLVLPSVRWLLFYSDHKHSIPTQSLWFKRIEEHRDWLLSDSTETDLMLSTAAELGPKPVPDPSWFEKEIGRALCDVVKALLAQGLHHPLADLLIRIKDLFWRISFNLDVPQSLELLRDVRGALDENPATFNPDTLISGRDEDTELVVSIMAQHEACDMAFLSILLGFSRRLEKLGAVEFAQLVRSIRWGHAKAIRQVNLPRELIQEIEHIDDCLSFETVAEGRPVSQEWYLIQLLALTLVGCVDSQLEVLISEFESIAQNRLAQSTFKSSTLLSVQFIQRWLEGCKKLDAHLAVFQTKLQSYSDLRKVADTPWVQIDWPSIGQRTARIRERLVAAYSELLIPLSTLPKSKRLPDFFGRAFMTLLDEAFFCMMRPDVEHFGRLFTALFLAQFSAKGRLAESLKNLDDLDAASLVMEPILDVVSLSGYAILYSELQGKDFWSVAKKAWDTFLGDQTSGKNMTTILYKGITARRSQFVLFEGDLRRTRWQTGFSASLREHGINIYGLRHIDPRGGKKEFHKSPVIRAAVKASTFTVDPVDVFLGMYIMKRPEAAGVTATPAIRDFLERLRIEEERDPKNDKEGGK